MTMKFGYHFDDDIRPGDRILVVFKLWPDSEAVFDHVSPIGSVYHRNPDGSLTNFGADDIESVTKIR